MAVEVTRDGETFVAYPRMFLNRRTQQLMVHPHVENFASGDLYISPLEFDPGESAGRMNEIELAKGSDEELGDLSIRFLSFDLERDGNALAAMATGAPVTIGARLEVTRGGVTTAIEPVYSFSADGRVAFPAAAAPGRREDRRRRHQRHRRCRAPFARRRRGRERRQEGGTLARRHRQAAHRARLVRALRRARRRPARPLPAAPRPPQRAAHRRSADRALPGHVPIASRSARSFGRPALTMRCWARSTG